MTRSRPTVIYLHVPTSNISTYMYIIICKTTKKSKTNGLKVITILMTKWDKIIIIIRVMPPSAAFAFFYIEIRSLKNICHTEFI